MASEDPFITVKQQHQTGDSFITLNQQHHQTGNSSTITVKQENQTGDSIITLKHQHQTGDSIITVKHENQTGDSIITVKKQQHPTGQDKDSIINVEVMNQNRRIVFRVNRNKPLQVILTKWIEMEGITVTDYQKVYFVYNGRRISDDDIYNKNKTISDMGLKDGDCITAELSLIGD
ncbi:hypothetical protein OSB04_017340 [Centaurea solstitialis]|uniref:Ubiquitin-like domain-containing protein n=1 Tax=Centaurea solstitialis TaxID=347529 RepID=A0AA38WI97_9ASTR|nr:hypothetical protein OSB04_017340 [Centaurea solstitialis]